ncbi:LmeA family phospholipid-binding protein [Corynebacterium mayonis]|uniref:LmeA family phospholipid-binding protein n=1 Tax=Corynebacterium mayonis TaxID=3062461 RepID=UPI0031407D58
MKTAWKVIVGVLAVVLVLLLAAEFGLRAYMSEQIRADAAVEGTEVSFGSQPLTLGLARGVVPHMSMTSPSTLEIVGDTATGQPASSVEVDNMRVNKDNQVAERLSMTSVLPEDYVRIILQQQLSEALQTNASFLDSFINVTGVSANPDNNTLDITFSGGAAGLELRPVMEGEKLKFTAESTELFGFTLPDFVTATITDALGQGVHNAVGGPLRLSDFAVVDGGMRVTLSGENVNLRELQSLASPL